MPPETSCSRSAASHSSLRRAGPCTCRENVDFWLVYCKCHSRSGTLPEAPMGWGRGRGRGEGEGGKQTGGSPAPCNDFGFGDGLGSELSLEVIHECLELLRRGSILLNHALEQKFKGARGG